MSDGVTININLAIQGDAVKPISVPVGSTLEDVKTTNGLPNDLEFRVKGEPVDSEYEFSEESDNDYLIGTRDAKGGIC